VTSQEVGESYTKCSDVSISLFSVSSIRDQERFIQFDPFIVTNLLIVTIITAVSMTYTNS